VIEACPTCDTLWRLYARAAENLHELVGKHGDSRGSGDHNTVEILSHEITIAESSLRAVRREIRRHETERHSQPRGNQEAQGKERKPQPQEK
jgi:hypothetical protein